MQKISIYLSLLIALTKAPIMASEFIPTYKNTKESSLISYVRPFPVGTSGTAGPYFLVTTADRIEQYFYQHVIAGFLNHESYGLSPDLIETLERAFHDVLEKKEDGSYVYTGEINSSLLGNFSAKCIQKNIFSFPEIPSKIGYFTRKNAQNISMYEIGVTSLNHEKTILGTFGAVTCIILAIFNPNDHTALLSHLSGGVSSKHFFPYLDQFSKDQGKKFQVYIAGSDHDTRDEMSTLIDDLQKRDDLEIVGVSLGDGFNDKSLAIDSETGEIFTHFVFFQLQDGDLLNEDRIDEQIKAFCTNPSFARLDEIKIPLKQAK